MPDYVFKIMSDPAAPDVDAVTRDIFGMAHGKPTDSMQEIRLDDPAEARAYAHLVKGLSHALGQPQVILYHVCAHSDGVGLCVPQVVD